jgi:hypothetical protein
MRRRQQQASKPSSVEVSKRSLKGVSLSEAKYKTKQLKAVAAAAAAAA